jgi:hypothetical protein
MYPKNRSVHKSKFSEQVDRLDEAEGDDFDARWDWRKFEIWHMYGTFNCDRPACAKKKWTSTQCTSEAYYRFDTTISVPSYAVILNVGIDEYTNFSVNYLRPFFHAASEAILSYISRDGTQDSLGSAAD